MANGLLELTAVLPALLGAGGCHDYLVLAQSGDELRPTGGFITSGGVLSLSDGRIAELQLVDSALLDPDGARVASPYAPEPLGRYMQIYRWMFRDANWSPDFPTAARMASLLYAQGGRPTPADVIALDTTVLRELLRVVGPVAIEGEAEPVTAATVLAFFERQHERDANNGAAVAALARALLTRLEQGDVAVGDLLQTAQQLLDERHILIAASDPAAADLLARLGWDGAVRPGAGDYVMVVDANVGYTRSNRSVEQALRYTVDLSDPTAPVATLAIRYTHPARATATCAELDARAALLLDTGSARTTAPLCGTEAVKLSCPRCAC